MATYSELKTEIENNGWVVLNESTGGTNNNLTSKRIDAGKVVGDAVITKTFNIYLYEANGEHYWQNADPFEPSTWYEEVNDFIRSVIQSGTIYAGFIKHINPSHETAGVLVYIDDGGGKTIEKTFFLNKNVNGDIQHFEVTV